jgi:hypothetical protein
MLAALKEKSGSRPKGSMNRKVKQGKRSPSGTQAPEPTPTAIRPASPLVRTLLVGATGFEPVTPNRDLQDHHPNRLPTSAQLCDDVAAPWLPPGRGDRGRPADQRPERGLLTAITLPAGSSSTSTSRATRPRRSRAEVLLDGCRTAPVPMFHSARAVPGRQGVIWIQLATEGTPSWLTRNSMYQPGGARLELAGTVAWTAPPP